ncbi:hypothetical protein MBANPS3_003908 [Mucor bainieri]
MKFADSNPPEIPDPYSVPSSYYHDTKTYHYYLSFLERFIEETKTIPSELRKVYLVRAEYRYVQYLQRKEPFEFSPTDIAFTGHAHLLNPRRYEDDFIRGDFRHGRFYFRLWHNSYSTAEKDNAERWKRSMGDEPYRLTPDNLLQAPFPEITCIVCSDTIATEWMEYAQWRTNPTVAVQCGRCDAMFTIKHVGKYNLVADLMEPPTKNSYVAMSELMDELSDAAHFIEASAPRLKSLPFNSGVDAIKDLLLSEQDDDDIDGDKLCAGKHT